MTIRQRLVAVGMMAGIMYVCVLVAGFNGFDLRVLAAVTGLFLVWHILVHEAALEPAPLTLAAVLHAVVAAALLGLGHLLGNWTGLRVDEGYPAAIAIVALTLARLWRVRPAEAEAIARSLDALQQRMAEAGDQDTAADGRETQDAPSQRHDDDDTGGDRSTGPRS